ncbi:fimbrial protein [Pseudomonas putida]|uniref:fimbrial protein n=1 Tax=Pseudomonas putida TaxID=303 RepID=UPI0009A1E549|nr:fimbrial protein [Pseudomonas putida]
MPVTRNICTALALLAFAGNAHASINCTWQSTPGPLSYRIDLGTPWIARDAPIGSIIGTVRALYAPEENQRSIRCENDGSGTLTFQATPTAPLHPGPLPPVNGWNVDGKVMETGIPGVGLHIRLGFPFAGGFSNVFTPTDDEAIPYLGENSQDSGATPLQISSLLYTPVLIKTGPIPTGPQHFSKQMVRSQISYLGDALNIHVSGGVHQAQCTLKSNPVSADPVQLGNHDRADFTGIGSTTPATDFHITLSDCEDDPTGSIARAHVRLEGARGSVPLLPAQGVFGLSSNSTATGVGIQILRSDSSPMPLQQDEPITSLVIGTTRLDFKARYYQTNATVTAGLAEGALDFTISYR